MALSIYILLGGLLQGGGYYLMTLGQARFNVAGGVCVALGLFCMFRGGSLANAMTTHKVIKEMQRHNQMLETKAGEMLAMVQSLKQNTLDSTRQQKVAALETDLHEWIAALMKVNPKD